jgi:hypothetical protein
MDDQIAISNYFSHSKGTKEKIIDFIYIDNAGLTTEENLKIKNRSDHDNILHHLIFNKIDEWVKRIIKDINNIENTRKTFFANQLTVVADEDSVVEYFSNKAKEKVANFKGFNSQNIGMLYRGTQFVKPSNLLPEYNNKLYLIKQKGTSESGRETNYLLNPFFFGFKMSLDIFQHTLYVKDFCGEEIKDYELEEGLIKIFTDKYGIEYEDIYETVKYHIHIGAAAGRHFKDETDEILMKHLITISGVVDMPLFKSVLFDTSIMTANMMARDLKAK